MDYEDRGSFHPGDAIDIVYLPEDPSGSSHRVQQQAQSQRTLRIVFLWWGFIAPIIGVFLLFVLKRYPKDETINSNLF